MAGYIGPAPVPQATQNREAFTATSGQTSFATAGYTPQFIDVYLNGVKLAAADYTATNGSDVVLSSGATVGDILEVVAFSAFTVADQAFTGTTTAANLTVTGAFTSQGIDDNADAVAITIDSSENVGIGTSSPNSYSSQTTLTINGSTYGRLDLESAGTLRASLFATTGSTTLSAATDVLSFDTSGGEAMRIDSSGNVGIGTSSPSGLAHVYNGMLQVGSKTGDTSIQQNTNAIRISAVPNSTTEWGGLQWYREFSDVIGAEIIASRPSSAETDTDLIFKTSTNSSNAVEAMRLDSSGNLLVGTTDNTVYNNSGSGTGINLQNFGNIAVARDSNDCMVLNRLNLDGAIANFAKDGAPVGSIGTTSSDLYIGTGDTTLRFADGVDGVIPTGTGGAQRDGAVNLGAASNRFQHLYLSGGVYLGGTGAANKLDDYEEGTWTPVVYDTNTSGHVLTLNNVIGKYKKIGNWVNCTLQVGRNDATSLSGVITITNLPFTVAAQGSVTGGTFWLDKASTDRIGVVYVVPSADRFYLLSDHAVDNYLLMSEWQNGRPIYIQVSYNSA